MTTTHHACARCGKDPAEGLATIDDVRYCHDGPSPTCYERAGWKPSIEALLDDPDAYFEAAMADALEVIKQANDGTGTERP